MNKDMSLLWLKSTRAAAFATERAPGGYRMFGGQIHLKPLEINPYVIITDSRTDITVFPENYTATLYNYTTAEQFDITDNVDILQLTDSNSIKQCYFRIAYLPEDFGGHMGYIRIQTSEGGESEEYNWYTNPFLLTNQNIEKTVRLDYAFNGSFLTNPVYQGIRLGFYYNNYVPATEIDTYYQLTTELTVNPRIAKKEYQEWIFEAWDAFTFKRVINALTYPCYIDRVRNYPVEDPNYAPRDGDSNISESFIVTNEDIFDRINLIIVIPGGDTVPFLASSGTLASTDYLISQEEIPDP